MSTDAEVKKTESLLRAILVRFNGELIEMDRHSAKILTAVCLFKDFREPSPDGKKQSEPQGIIEEFNDLLDNMNSYNHILSQAEKGLSEFVG